MIIMPINWSIWFYVRLYPKEESLFAQTQCTYCGESVHGVSCPLILVSLFDGETGSGL